MSNGFFENENSYLNILAQETNAIQTAIARYDNVVIAIRAFTLTVTIAGIGFFLSIINNFFSHYNINLAFRSIKFISIYFDPELYLFVSSFILFQFIFFFIFIAEKMENNYRFHQKKFMLRMSLITIKANHMAKHSIFNNDNSNDIFKDIHNLHKCLQDENKIEINETLDLFINKLFTLSNEMYFTNLDITMNYFFSIFNCDNKIRKKIINKLYPELEDTHFYNLLVIGMEFIFIILYIYFFEN